MSQYWNMISMRILCDESIRLLAGKYASITALRVHEKYLSIPSGPYPVMRASGYEKSPESESRMRTSRLVRERSLSAGRSVMLAMIAMRTTVTRLQQSKICCI